MQLIRTQNLLVDSAVVFKETHGGLPLQHLGGLVESLVCYEAFSPIITSHRCSASLGFELEGSIHIRIVSHSKPRRDGPGWSKHNCNQIIHNSKLHNAKFFACQFQTSPAFGSHMGGWQALKSLTPLELPTSKPGSITVFLSLTAVARSTPVCQEVNHTELHPDGLPHGYW